MDKDQVQRIAIEVSQHKDYIIPSATKINKMGEMEEGKPFQMDQIQNELSGLLQRDPAVFLGTFCF
jgi:hypothetical protein